MKSVTPFWGERGTYLPRSEVKFSTSEWRCWQSYENEPKLCKVVGILKLGSFCPILAMCVVYGASQVKFSLNNGKFDGV